MKPRAKKPIRLTIGKTYRITYDDHFCAFRLYLQDPSHTVIPSIISMGTLIFVGPTHIVLRSAEHGDDQHDIYGIITSCITRIEELK